MFIMSLKDDHLLKLIDNVLVFNIKNISFSLILTFTECIIKTIS